MEYDDTNIPMNCPECNFLEEGIDKMFSHVIDFHPNYSPEEAVQFVHRWAEKSYEAIEKQEMKATIAFQKEQQWARQSRSK